MNNKQLSKLPILPVNKTVVFYSPLEGKDILVRTGTLGDDCSSEKRSSYNSGEDNSFIHSIFHAYSDEYVQLEKKGRNKLVSKLYTKLHDKLVEKRWEQSSNSMIVHVPFQDNIVNLFTDFYRFVKEDKDCKTKKGKKIVKKLLVGKKDVEAYQIICDLVNLKNLQKSVLPNAFDKCNEQVISKCKEIILQNVNSYIENILNDLGDSLDSQRKKFCIDKMDKLCETIFDIAEDISKKEFIDNIKTLNISIDPDTIAVISDKFNRDIYFIDSKTRMPYHFENKDNIKGRKSIVLMWLGGNHYEVVGKLLHANRIQRQFDEKDSLIKRINTFLFKPDMIPELYPNLKPYLKDVKLQRSSSHSKSVSRSKSSSSSSELKSNSSSTYSEQSRSSSNSDYSSDF